jgi:RNA polymerase-binding transcription factor DksA
MTPLAIEAQRRLEEHRTALERLLALAGEGAGKAALDLAETQAALDRIASGKYGRCESCNGAIGRQRLLALPAARYCIGCASSSRAAGR